MLNIHHHTSQPDIALNFRPTFPAFLISKKGSWPMPAHWYRRTLLCLFLVLGRRPHAFQTLCPTLELQLEVFVEDSQHSHPGRQEDGYIFRFCALDQVWTCENPCASMTKGTLHTFQRVIWSKLFAEPSSWSHGSEMTSCKKGKASRTRQIQKSVRVVRAYCKFTVSINDPKLDAIPESDLRPWQSPYEDSSAIQIIKQISSRAPQYEKNTTNNLS